MRGVDKEKKMPLDPLFPRLHILGTEPGGSRAPPRNKMAFCGPMNTPSQRFSPGTIPMPMPPLPASNDSNLGHRQKMNGFSLFHNGTEADSNKPARIHSNCLDGMNVDAKDCNQIFRSGYYKALTARRPLRITHPYRYNHPLNCSAKLHLKKDDPGIPYFGRKGNFLNGGRVDYRLEKELDNSSSLSPLEKHKTAIGSLERTNVMPMEYLGNQAKFNSKVHEMSDKKGETFHPLPSSDHNVSANADLGVQAAYKNHESGNRELIPLHHVKSRFLNGLSTTHDSSPMDQEGRSLLMETTRTGIVMGYPERFLRKRTTTAMEGPMCSSSSTGEGENHRTPSRMKFANESPRVDHCKALPLEEFKRTSAISDTYLAESTSGLHVTPDVMMRVIGPNFFWRARTTIEQQQRVFVSQRFELYRLIKVQRLIARSPKMLMEGNVIFSKPSANFLTENKLQMKIIPESPLQSVKPKVESPQLEPFADYAVERAQGKLRATYDSKKGGINPNSIVKPDSFVPIDTKFGPFFNNQPSEACQWLVPVRSPSEGLVYKLYTGPCPPQSPGCITSVYGSHGTTLSLTRMDATAYVNTTTYNFPASNQQHGIVIYSSPGESAHSPDMDNTTNPDSAVMQQFGTIQSSGKYTIPHQRSCNPGQGSRTITDSGEILPGFRDVESQGSPEGVSHFPTTPTDQMLRYSEQRIQNDEKKTHVIKVVPHHSSKSASESAARIFQRIQEERRKRD